MKIAFNFFRKNGSSPLLFLEECLSKDEVINVKTLDFKMLISTDREKRLKILTDILAKDKAIWLNSHIEKNFILKNQKENLMTWVNGRKDIKAKYREEIIKKISELENPLNEKGMDAFLEELAGLALGIGVTSKEAQIIIDLCRKRDNAKLTMENGGSENDYEIARKNLDDFIEMAGKS